MNEISQADFASAFPRTARLLNAGVREGWQIGGQLYVSRGGKTLADHAFGRSDAETVMKQDTLMPWLSSGKPLTAIAIARLWEEGRIRLEDAASQHVPEFAQRGKDRITLQHLLTHTGGFRTADRVPIHLEWDDTIQRICQEPLEPDWVPGQKAGYHISSSWFLLGEIIRRVTGKEAAAFVRDEVCQPLGMMDCWLGMPAAQVVEYGPRLGVMHTTSPGQAPIPHPVWEPQRAYQTPRPGSNICGPIRELGRFYEALLAAFAGNSPILKVETARHFTGRTRIGLFDHTFQHILDWSLGFIVSSNRYGPETVPYSFGRHVSEETFGHGGSQSSCGFADPIQQVVVAWVMNGMPGERIHSTRSREINSALYADLGLA